MSVSLSSPAQSEGYLSGTWTIDPIHSYVGFVIKHLMAVRIRGQFEQVTGEIVTAERIEDSTVNATIDVASIHTNNEQRNEHLRSADFFDVEQHPTIAFASTRFRRAEDALLVDGAFTMHGVTKDITLTAALPAFGGPGPDGSLVVGFSATGSVNRSNFDLDFNIPMQGGGMALGDEVQLVLEIEATLNGEAA
jgi:polyisoprenoid-binding protein YceI